MVEKFITFLVRLAAVVSFAGLVTGYSWSDSALVVIDFVMLAIWLHMDWNLILTFTKTVFKR